MRGEFNRDHVDKALAMALESGSMVPMVVASQLADDPQAFAAGLFQAQCEKMPDGFLRMVSDVALAELAHRGL